MTELQGGGKLASKKMLTLLVLLTALIISTAGADGYTVYGTLHSSGNMLKNGDDSQLGLTSNNSRFGVKGDIELNENFTFVWQFENSLDMINGGGGFATRNSYVGFKHASAGKIIFGLHDSPFMTLGRKVDMFDDELGDTRTLISHGPLSTFDLEGLLDAIFEEDVSMDYIRSQWDTRLNNLVGWFSPEYNGFNAFLAYKLDTGDKLDFDPSQSEDQKYRSNSFFSVMGSYTKDEIFVGVAFEKHPETESSNYSRNESGKRVYTYGDAPAAFRIAGSYTKDQFKVAALYQVVYTQALLEIMDERGFVDINSNVMGASAQYMVTPKWAVKAAYYISNEFTEIDDGLKAKMIVIGTDLIINKNVKVYGQFAKVSNDILTDVELGGSSDFGGSVSGSAMTDGEGLFEDPSGFSFGTVVTW